ncbi:hypothetical protein TWF970_001081 [Orbilia oligospora]|uniref:Uncharacterized protein n=1 Tax=Orbilia oligospora TaxID=2813651 RepID=A0A7C8REH4_ORBOL|nr:hypothetical protein TWF970_001081 [Orbilia oligospora]
MVDRKDYTVGWICAIECEYIAAKTFLDKKHPTPEDIPLTDNNVYTVGEISKHNVVIVTLPGGQYGISSATAVVKDMLNTFQNIRIGLMVGIGGGAPLYMPGADERDIRLGDVVVSKPFDGRGGVIQYDFGKNNQGQDFKLTGFLNQPPLLLLAAITELSSEYAMIEGGNGIKGHINSVLEKYPTLRANYERPGSTSDKLYRSEIVHPDNSTAEASCATLCGDDLSNLTKRPERSKNDNPIIHYEKQQDIYRWLSPPDSSTNYNAAIKEQLQGSGLWFIESSEFSEWKRQRNSLLWLHGIPGCGKTILSSIIITHLKHIYSNQLLYFYFDYKDVDKQSLEGMLRGLISQLYYRSRRSSGVLESFFASYHDGKDQPTCQSLRMTFLSMAEKTGEIWLVLDALDECNREKRKELMLWINEINACSEERNIHFLITSRSEADIESEVRKCITASWIISIGSELISEDINAYIKCRVTGDTEFSRWKSRVEQTEIEDVLTRKANGMFRWAKCQLDVLGNCLDPDSLHNALGSLPETLDETYARIIRNMPNIYKKKAIRILQFLTYSPRPVEVVEIVDALAVDTDEKTYFDSSRRMPCPNEVLHYCSGLVVISSQKPNPVLQLAHLSVREYLTSDRLGVVDLQISRGLQEVDAKTSMAKICIAYLLSLSSAYLLSLRSAYLLSLSSAFYDSPAKVESPPFPFFQYCANYWTTFARTAEEVDERVRCLILQLFDNERLYKYCCGEQFFYLSENETVSALRYASAVGLRVQVERFLSQKVDVDSDCVIAASEALRQSHWGIVELFLNKGVRADTKEMALALYQESLDGCYQTVKFLLQRGVDAGRAGGFYGNPLAAASSQGHLSIVKLLLDYGADLNVPSGPWAYPLCVASFKGHYDVVELLLDRGVKIGLQGSQLHDAFMMACRRYFWDIVRLFVDRGLDVKAHGGGGLTIALNGGNYSIFKLLLDRGAYINHSAALHAAAEKGNQDIVELLLNSGAGPWNTTEALSAASFNGDRNIVRMLLDAAQGSNTDDNDSRGSLALYTASVGGHRDVWSYS